MTAIFLKATPKVTVISTVKTLGRDTAVRDRGRFANSANFGLTVWYPQLATQVCLIRCGLGPSELKLGRP